MKPEKDFLRHLAAFNSRQVYLESNPCVIYLESVKGCPLSCAMCHNKRTTPKMISETLLKRIEPYFMDLEVMAIHGEGEPLLSNLRYFVERSVRHDFVLHMNSTGLLLTRKIADLLLKTRLSIRFSIHSGSKKTYRKVIGYDLDRVSENISYLVKRARSSDKGHDFWLSFLVMKENIEEIEDFLRLAHDWGIHNVRFERLSPNWQSLRGVDMKDRNFTFKYFEQYNEHIRAKFLRKLPGYQNLAHKLGIDIHFSSPLSHKEGFQPIKELSNTVTTALFGRGLFPLSRFEGACLAPWFGQLIINQKGTVRLCCQTEYVLGNLYDATLDEIWNSKKMQAVRRSFKKGRIPRICGYCRGFSFDNYPANSFVGIARNSREQSL
ncbi:MAG: radical SAM protein [Deltaproteobacteria bacterium]|nr:radical SAM protein [Deltaproteobacteria bacterium]